MGGLILSQYQRRFAFFIDDKQSKYKGQRRTWKWTGGTAAELGRAKTRAGPRGGAKTKIINNSRTADETMRRIVAPGKSCYRPMEAKETNDARTKKELMKRIQSSVLSGDGTRKLYRHGTLIALSLFLQQCPITDSYG